MADKSLKNKMKILELEKPLGDLVSAMDAMTGGKFSKKRKRAAKFIEIKDKLGMKDGGLAEAIEKVKKEDAVKMEAGGDPANALKGGQKKLDKNKDGKISGEDFEILRNMKFGGSVKPVKMGAGGGVCKGMGIARAGGKFKLR